MDTKSIHKLVALREPSRVVISNPILEEYYT